MNHEKIRELEQLQAVYVRELYDRNLNMTLKELSQTTGLSVSKLKTILMG